MVQLKIWVRSATMVSGSAWTTSGLLRMPPTESTSSGSAAIWSRCECVRNTWSMRASSSMLRSSTPVPASMRMSSSTMKEVVRARAPMPPLHPSTLTFIPFPGFHRSRLGPADLVAELSRHEHLDLAVPAVDRDRAHRLESPQYAPGGGGRAHQDGHAVALRQRFEAGGQVDRITDHGVRATQLGAHVAHGDF